VRNLQPALTVHIARFGDDLPIRAFGFKGDRPTAA
jgi:hypothetical protein